MLQGLAPSSSSSASHSQSHAPSGDGKATAVLPNAWSGFELTDLGRLRFPERPAVLSSTWEKFRAAVGHRSTAYETARAERRAVKSTRADWLTSLRGQLSTYLGQRAIDLLPVAKGLGPNDGKSVRKLLGERVRDLRSLPNEELQACITSFGKARNYYEASLRKVFDAQYIGRSPSPTVGSEHLSMVLYFLLEDMLKDPALAPQVNARARQLELDSKNAQATPGAGAVNRIRREVLEQANREVSQAQALNPDDFTVFGLGVVLEKVLRDKGLLGQPAGPAKAVDQLEPGASATPELEASSFLTRAHHASPKKGPGPDEVPLDFEAAKQHVARYLQGRQKFKDLPAESQATLLATLDKTLAQNLDKSSRAIKPSDAVARAKEALNVYTPKPLPERNRWAVQSPRDKS